jgi:hypothetical protein
VENLQTASAQAEVAVPLADDLLRGVKRIAREIGETERRTYYLLENKLLPAGKQGALWLASRRAIHEHYARLTGAV